MRETKTLKIAILNMYLETTENQGLRCIDEILTTLPFPAEFDYFNVRYDYQLPGLDYDVYISTGGPGNPLENNLNWTPDYFKLVDKIIDWNNTNKETPKYWFAICHSFQMLCSYLEVGTINKREYFSFGIVPLKKTKAGQTDELFDSFEDSFYAADHRYFQVVSPDLAKLDQLGASIIALDEYNPAKPAERSVMAVRFSNEMVGVQFHPEADVKGMYTILENEKTQADINRIYGNNKLNEINGLLRNPDTIDKMNKTLLPQFLESCQKRLIYSHSFEAVNESV